jgi:hypothetical protein
LSGDVTASTRTTLLNFEDCDDVLTPRQAAAVAKVGHNQLLAAIRRGELEAARLGPSTIRVTRVGLMRWLGLLPPPQPPPPPERARLRWDEVEIVEKMPTRPEVVEKLPRH